MPMNRLHCFWSRPALVWVVVLIVVCTAEAVVMLVLPLAMPQESSWLVQTGLDAVLLTLVLAPVLWWTVVRPLKQVIQICTRFAARLVDGMEALRRELAHELHDGVGQSVTLLVSGLRSIKSRPLSADAPRRLDELQRIAQEALNEIRRMSLGLRPSLLDNLGLAPAIEQVAVQTSENHPIKVEVDVHAITGKRFAEAVETALFRILQEALSNVIKHAAATRVSIAAQFDGHRIALTIADNGRGFSEDVKKGLAIGSSHLGLLGLRERAALLHGSLTIDSQPGQGTRLTASIPVGELHRDSPDSVDSPGDYVL